MKDKLKIANMARYLLLLLCVLNITNGLYINRAFQTIDSWTHLGEFCFLPRGGIVKYHVESSLPVPIVLYYNQPPRNLSQDNGIKGIDHVEDVTEPNELNATLQYTEDPVYELMDDLDNSASDYYSRYTTARLVARDEFSEYKDYPEYENLKQDPNYEDQDSECGEHDIWIFQNVEMTGKGKFTIISETNDVLCLKFAISPQCHQTLDTLKIELTITNKAQTFWWKHVSAENASLFLADLITFGFVLMLCIIAGCIRVYLKTHKFYVHALNSCILSMLLLLLVLGTNILLHGLFCVDGYDVGHVRVIIHVIYIAAQALFVQAIYLHALKHVWCNEEAKLERGYSISLVVSAATLFFGLGLVAIHVYKVFTEEVIIAHYAQFSLQGLMWVIFVFLILCTVSSSSQTDDKSDPGPKLNANSSGE